jgi:hypothetical protein
MTTLSRLQRLRNRRTGFPDSTILAKEAFDRIQEEDAVKYLVGAMQPIDPTYTKNTFAEADRVKIQLSSGYQAKNVDAAFDYHGSVTNDTHILAYSDIDLLTVNEKFTYKENPAMVTSPYRGNAVSDLINQHDASIDIIKSKFPEVIVDTSGGKAIQLSGGSLRRKIDVVTCTWWDTIAYDLSRLKKDRGIKVFDYSSYQSIENKPFFHNHEIDTKDKYVGGNLRKVIRLLKTLKAEANEESGQKKVAISSYDIAAISWNMPNNYLSAGEDEELKLAVLTHGFLNQLESDPILRTSLDVPNRTRRIFCQEGATLDGLKALNKELSNLLIEIETGLRRSMRTLNETRIKKF